jgi:hypothetical protein
MFVVAALTACAPPPVLKVSSLNQEARSNELAAVAAHRGERLRVTGVVTGMGFKKVRSVYGEAGPPVFGVVEVEMSERQTAYPYLYAQDPAVGDAGGQLLCFFEPDDLDEVSQVAKGSAIVVDGDFQEYSRGGTLVVLRNCKLTD